MSVVRIPTVLRAATGGQREVTVGGETVAEVLESLYAEHPAVRQQLEGSDGGLHRFVNIYLNDEDVRLLEWLETPVGPEDTLTILPAMAGGR
ncbi:MAG TPA: MoaD/ThiS family protein [Miltoncostaeaceae bacterium]|nr:MoaD/ThiS family protein [Miltoncostaeaceae bacterium]